MTEATRRLLRSGARLVVVEAPAGCGKTYEAVSLALDTVGALPPGRKVLLLAHTNAAKEEFTRRTRVAASRIEVNTIDAFSVRLLAHYASAVNLPTPLERNIGPRGDGVPFTRLASEAVQLMRRAPTIARLEGNKYPLIIGDEHQDANRNQHEVLKRLADAGGGRLRLFGDPMQAIFNDEGSLPWSDVIQSAEVSSLSAPQRWQPNPPLADWILKARDALRRGDRLPLTSAPDCVSVIRCGLARGGAYQQKDPRVITAHIQCFVRRVGTDSFSVLARSNDAVSTIESSAHFLCIRINEGADHEQAYKLLDAAVAAGNDPSGLSQLLLDYARDCSVGITMADHARLVKVFGPDRLISPPKGRLAPLATVFEPIYAEPSLLGFFQGCKSLLRLSSPTSRLRRSLCLRLLSTLSKRDGEMAKDELSASISARKALAIKPGRTTSTIHKAKGLEFDHVLVAFCGDSHFPDDERSRRILYVALSRATLSLALHVPKDRPSPLLE